MFSKVRAVLASAVTALRGQRVEREFGDELTFHVEQLTRDNVSAGMTPGEAHRQALLSVGGVDKAREEHRDARGFRWLGDVGRDMRYALRGLRKNPAFALAAISSLALGVGASLAIFTVADNFLIRPLPYPDASRLVMVWETDTGQRGDTQKIVSPRNSISPANYLDWRAQNDVFETIGAFNNVKSVLSDGKRAEEVDRQVMTADVLPMLGVQPIRGRLFTAEDDRPGKDNVILISYRVWQSWFGGDEQIIGRQVQINSTPRTVIGVMPPGFYFRNRSTDVWGPMGLNPAENFRKTSGRYMMCLARLKPGITMEQANAQMRAIAKRLEMAYPEFDANWTVNVEPLRDSLVYEVKTSLLLLLGAVGLLLAVACANVANLLLARYTARRREMAVRGALGAARVRLIRQLLTESVVLGLAGGLCGLLLARWAVLGLVALAPREITQSTQVVFDLRIVFFALALSVLTGVLFGLTPAVVTSRSDLMRAMRDDTRSSIGGTGRLRAWLVAAEVALSVMLLAGAGLLFRSLVGLEAVDPGLDPDNVLTFRVSIPRARYKQPAQTIQFFSRAVERMRQLPGVRAASAISYLPFDGDAAGTWVQFAGRPRPRPGDEALGIIRTVLPGYFRTMGIPLKRGRDFTAGDNTVDSPYRFIVNETFVRKYFPNEQPLGKQISTWMDDKNPFGEIVGVVADVKEGAVDKEPAPTVYYVHAHLNYSAMVFVVRAQNNPLGLVEPVKGVIHELDPSQPVAEVRLMEEVVRGTFGRQRFSAILLAGFSLASLLLAAIGVYGVLAYSVTERTREIGVRVALGAEPRQIVGMVVGAGARLVAAGTLAGLAGAIALSGLLKSLLFGVGPRDPLTLTAVPVSLMAVALVAAYLPARRAARLAPVEALRGE